MSDKVPCPKCGYENRATAVVCNLCKTVLRTETRKSAKIAQKLETRRSFYSQQESNRRKSFMLMTGLFSLLCLLGAAIGLTYGSLEIGAAIAFATALAFGGFGWFGAGPLIMSMSGARQVSHDDAPQLYNVIEEMKIASGLPMPKVYIIESPAPNAFATGRDPENSAVAVTTGLISKLNREELQGVIAHEMSHIRHLDIRYATLAVALVGATALIADGFLRGFGRGRTGMGNLPLLIIAMLFALLAPLSARLLQMAISRQREFLADAGAVELTRNPEGLASALEKIATDPEPLEGANRATAPLYIINPLKSFSMKSSALFSTHPPTEARISALRAMGANTL